MNKILKSILLIAFGGIIMVSASSASYSEISLLNEINDKTNRVYRCDWPAERLHFWVNPPKGLKVVASREKVYIIVDDPFLRPSVSILESRGNSIFQKSALLVKTTFDSSSGIVTNEFIDGEVLTHQCKQVTADN